MREGSGIELLQRGDFFRGLTCKFFAFVRGGVAETEADHRGVYDKARSQADGGAGETPERDEEKCALHGDCGGDAAGEVIEIWALHRSERHGIAAGKRSGHRDDHEHWDEPGIAGKLAAEEEALDGCGGEAEKRGEEQRCSRETQAGAMGEL